MFDNKLIYLEKIQNNNLICFKIKTNLQLSDIKINRLLIN